jgi:hypothetical protein
LFVETIKLNFYFFTFFFIFFFLFRN